MNVDEKNINKRPNKESLITIITVVYNGHKYIDKTIKSVLNQSYHNIEYVIIDGGSSDGTLEIIKKYEKQIDRWISEEDEGIYDAMNKGINIASGEWINFMNAGDLFCDEDVIQSLLPYLSNESIDVLVGNTEVIYDDDYSKSQKGGIDDFRFGLPFCHQSSFIRTSLIKRKKFDLSYKVSGDLVTYFELFKEGAHYKYIDKCISKFDYNGVSSNFSLQSELEKLRFGKKNFKFYTLQFIPHFLNKLIRAQFKKILPQKIVRKIQVSK